MHGCGIGYELPSIVLLRNIQKGIQRVKLSCGWLNRPDAEGEFAKNIIKSHKKEHDNLESRILCILADYGAPQNHPFNIK